MLSFWLLQQKIKYGISISNWSNCFGGQTASMEILDRLLISLFLLLSSTCLAGQVIQVLAVLVVYMLLCNSVQGDLETQHEVLSNLSHLQVPLLKWRNWQDLPKSLLS